MDSEDMSLKDIVPLSKYITNGVIPMLNPLHGGQLLNVRAVKRLASPTHISFAENNGPLWRLLLLIMTAWIRIKIGNAVAMNNIASIMSAARFNPRLRGLVVQDMRKDLMSHSRSAITDMQFNSDNPHIQSIPTSHACSTVRQQAFRTIKSQAQIKCL
ncbi:MAG: hypothetical protein NC113_02710 [Bacteroides sp.]|nr:hypothetical protein [Bacteroides sp.]MCM1447122.1 hypothetical protein [Bacteroides sp.]